MLQNEEIAVDSRRYAANSKSIQFGPWHIEYDISCILPSMCSTKFVCERDDDQFCQFCVYCKELKIPHFPDMVFPKNFLRLSHNSGATINFNPLDALRCVACTVEAIEVSCAEAWQEARPDAEKKKRNFDWTFSTNYKGTLTNNIVVEPTDETINYEMLKQKEQILFYHDLTLFEDELHDHGVSKLSVKIRVMPSCWYILLRYFMRVDDVLVRAHETRMFHILNSDYVLREFTVKESKAQDLNVKTDRALSILSIKNCQCQYPKILMLLITSKSLFYEFCLQKMEIRKYLVTRIVNHRNVGSICMIHKIPTSQMKEADDVIPHLPLKDKVTEKLIVNF